MQDLTTQGSQAVQNLAQRYGVSADAVRTLLYAVSAGGGTMAQFYHPELGGGGQWMLGGMTMVGDMFNHGLKALVTNLCSELSSLLASTQIFVPLPIQMGGGTMASNAWWPAELGQPSSSGGQNDARYAYFPAAQRLAIERGGRITVYDTLDHNIGGVQQQQGGPWGSLSFSSQRGTFTVESLPTVSGAGVPSYDQQASNNDAPAPEPRSYQQFAQSDPQPSATTGHEAVLAALEKLGDLHHRGILSDDEFKSKKAELLARL